VNLREKQFLKQLGPAEKTWLRRSGLVNGVMRERTFDSAVHYTNIGFPHWELIER
jgi:hypothetical protein